MAGLHASFAQIYGYGICQFALGNFSRIHTKSFGCVAGSPFENLLSRKQCIHPVKKRPPPSIR